MTSHLRDDHGPGLRSGRLRDISVGSESSPIPAEDLSSAQIGALKRLQYIKDSVYPDGKSISEYEGQNANLDEEDEAVTCTCSAEDSGRLCSRSDGEICDCVSSFGNFYTEVDDETIQQLHVQALPENLPLVECSPHCTCGEACSNHLTQKGVRLPLTIRPVNRLGLGLFYTPLKPKVLQPGTFVCLYAGEYLDTAEARSRWNSASHSSFGEGEGNYTLSIRVPNQIIHIDPRYKGNVGRFLNHSCDPNCMIQVVYWGTEAVPRAAIFTKREVVLDEELTFDYGNASGSRKFHAANKEGSWSLSEGRLRCLCGSSVCRGWLPFDETL